MAIFQAPAQLCCDPASLPSTESQMCQLSFDSQSASQRCQSECSLAHKCSSSSSSRPVTVVINKVSRAGKRRALFTTVYVKLLTGCSASVMPSCCCCCCWRCHSVVVVVVIRAGVVVAGVGRVASSEHSEKNGSQSTRQQLHCSHTHRNTNTRTCTQTHTEKLARCNVLAAADCEVKINTQY